MATNPHIHRLVIAVPAAMQGPANTFFKENIDPDGGEKTFTRAIVRTILPDVVVGYIANIALAHSQLKTIAMWLYNNLTGLPQPTPGMTPQEQRQWFQDARQAAWDQKSIVITPADQLGSWPDVVARLAERGLEFQQTEEL